MMKEIKKRKLTSKRILLIALSSLLVLLIAGYITVKLTVKDNGTGGGASEPPEIMEGEAVYLNTTIAYPQVSEAAIQYILVQNALGTFDLTRPDSKSSFWLGYDNGGGVREMVLYAPPIIGAEGDFNYEDLYAVEGNDGYGRIYMLTYLCTALGTPYFSERIELPKSGRGFFPSTDLRRKRPRPCPSLILKRIRTARRSRRVIPSRSAEEPYPAPDTTLW